MKKKLIFIIVFLVIEGILHVKGIDTFIKTEISFKINSLIKFNNITKKMLVKKNGYLSIYYDDELSESKLEYINKSIKKCDDKVDRILGSTTLYPLNIVLLSRDKFNSKFHLYSNDNVSLYANNVIYLCIDNMSEHAIVHEYSHYKLDSFCNDNKIKKYKIPSWFNEGLAEYISYSITNNVSQDKNLLPKVKKFKNLETPKETLKAYKEGYRPYEQYYLAIKVIVSNSNINIIRNILVDSKNANFYNSIESNSKMDIEKIEKILIDTYCK